MEDSTRKSLFLRHLSAATWAVMAEAAYTYPLDTIKTLLQVSAESSKVIGISSVVEAVRMSSGLQGFYGGVGWMLIGRLPVLCVRFGVYELITAFYTDGRKDSHVYASEACLAGLFAGVMESLVATPFDLLKLRAQMNSATKAAPCLTKGSFPSEGSGLAYRLLPGFSPDVGRWNRISHIFAQLPTKHVNLVDSLKDYPWLITGSGHPPLARDAKGFIEIVSLEGWRTLWRGFQPGLCRDAIFGSIFFSSWQFLHDAIMDWKALQMNPPPSSLNDLEPLTPLQLSVTAGIAASLAATASHSFDTARSRTQGTIFPKYMFMERKLLKWKTSESWYERLCGLNPFDRKFLRRGFVVRVAQQGAAACALIGTYNMALLYFLNQKR